MNKFKPSAKRLLTSQYFPYTMVCLALVSIIGVGLANMPTAKPPTVAVDANEADTATADLEPRASAPTVSAGGGEGRGPQLSWTAPMRSDNLGQLNLATLTTDMDSSSSTGSTQTTDPTGPTTTGTDGVSSTSLPSDPQPSTSQTKPSVSLTTLVEPTGSTIPATTAITISPEPTESVSPKPGKPSRPTRPRPGSGG